MQKCLEYWIHHFVIISKRLFQTQRWYFVILKSVQWINIFGLHMRWFLYPFLCHFRYKWIILHKRIFVTTFCQFTFDIIQNNISWNFTWMNSWLDFGTLPAIFNHIYQILFPLEMYFPKGLISGYVALQPGCGMNILFKVLPNGHVSRIKNKTVMELSGNLNELLF